MQQRTPWLLLKQFPQLLPVGHLDDLTSEQHLWLTTQIMIDQGYRLCAQCQTIGTTAFCEQCGTSHHPQRRTPQECRACKIFTTGNYCGQCGGLVYSETIAQLESGTFDWGALEKQLAPFLGGVTPEEEAGFYRAIRGQL